MTSKINQEFWLAEFDIPSMSGQPDQMGNMVPTTQPGSPGDPMGTSQPQSPDQNQSPEEDITDDPKAPDMPDDFDNQDDGGEDFEVWKNGYYKESIKGDTNVLLKLLHQVRDRNLEAPQRKFVEDNIQIQNFRQHANILETSKEIRSLIKKELDQNNPATSLVEHITMSVDKSPYVNNVYIRLSGLTGAKGDYHRKFIGALIGGVQVGSGGNKEDLVYNEDSYSILISTRCHSKFGDVNFGNWSMLEDDPERYLKEPELKKLEDGSPEEKDVLRRRVVMESISEQYKTRAFVINVTGEDGTVYHLGIDLATCLKSAYTEGKLVVRTRHSDNSEAMITDEGAIVPYMDLNIQYVQNTGTVDADGKAETEELDFIERRDGMLFLVANLNVIRNASSALQGINFKEVPYRGNPSDIQKIARNVPSITEILMRQQ